MNHPYQNRPHQVIHQVPHPVQPGFQVRGPVIQQKANLSEAPVAAHYYPPVNAPHPNVNNVNVAHQAQLFQQYANSSSHPPQQQYPPQQATNQMHFPPPHPQNSPTALIPPPQLHQQRDQDDTINTVKAPNTIQQSSEPRNSQQNEGQVRDIIWGEQEQASVFWQQKFFLIYEKFEWFGSRFEMLKSEYIALSEQLLTVDSEEDWNELKNHHEEFAQKLEEMFQQLIAVADENQQLINQRLQEDDGVWQRRYHELLSNFKALQEKTSMLEVQNQEIKTQQQQQSQAQQQGNYPELLSHYRNLQEEYEKLYNAYNKLQEEYEVVKSNPVNSNGPSLEDFENMRMEYQRTLETIHGQNDQLKTECQGFYEENEHLKEQLQHQIQAYAETEQLAKALHEKEQLTINLSSQLNEWKRNYEQLEHQLNQLVQRQSSKAQQIIVQLQNQLTLTKQQLSAKQSQLTLVSKKLQDQAKTRQHLIHEHQQELVKAVKLQSDKHLRQKQILESQLNTLHQGYEELLKKNSERDLGKYQVQTQEKRLALMKEENQNLIVEIRAKNVQLAALRNVSLQVATYENILDQYKALEREKLNLQETNRKEHSQLLQIKKKLTETEHEFSQFKTLSTSTHKPTSSLKHLENQLSHHQQIASKLQSQTNKLQQLLSSKEGYIRDLEEESVRQVIKVEHLQRVMEQMREDHQGQVALMEKRIEGLERRNQTSELEFRQEIVDNYEREIKELRQANEEKLKKTKKLQNQLHELNTRSTHLQRSSTSYNSQLHLLQQKLASVQSTNTDLLSKLTLARQSIAALEQQLSSLKDKELTIKTQLNSYTVQIQQADNLIRNKNSVIEEFEKQVKEFVEKIAQLETKVETERKDKLERVKKCDEEIEKLKERLYSSSNSMGYAESRRESFSHHRYSSSYSNRYLTFGPKQPQRNEQITKMQTTIIEQMNQENSKLRQEILELTKKINSLETLSRVIANDIEQSPTKTQKSKSRISIKEQNVNQPPAERDTGYVEERLAKFNERLEHCIQDNQLIAARDVDLTASQRIVNYEKEKREMEIGYEKQIKALKDQITSLTQQLASQAQVASAQPNLMESDLKEFAKYDILTEQAQKSTEQELVFLRSKLTHQQKTNSVLIKLNSQLKQQLEESLQKSSQSTTEYYKMQWKETEKSLEEEKLKSKKLSEENKRLTKENLEHDTKLMKEYELKIFNVELQLKQLERENSYFKLMKNRADNEKANLLHDVNVYSADIQTIKASTDNKVQHYERLNNELKEKCQLLEQELSQVSHSNSNHNYHLTNNSAHHNFNAKLINSNDKLRLSGSSNRRLAAQNF